jgi:hypothetical protein
MQPRSVEAARRPAFVRTTGSPSRRPALLLAALALCVGLLVYLADRRPGDTLLLPRFATLGTGPLFGAIASWLPSFVHPFAFSLLSAAVPRRPATSVHAAYRICAFWWAVNLVFEIGQHPRASASIAEALQASLGRNGVTAVISRFFLRGRFDWGDIAALSAGALAAAAVLWWLHKGEDGHDS